MGKLTARQVETSKAKVLIDGKGLRLVRRSDNARSWVYRKQYKGRNYEIGLGSYPLVGLAEARSRAIDNERLILAGKDPIALKNADSTIPTFEALAIKCHEERKFTYSNVKASNQWINTLRDYAFPKFGKLPVNEVTHVHVFEAINEIWLAKNETARKTRQRILTVIDFAVAKGFREHSIPATVINRSLPKYDKKVKHHAALPYPKAPSFLAEVRKEQSIARLALEMAILTGSRTGEIRQASWGDFDFKNRIWVRPDDKMKNKMVHIVPLTLPMIKVLKQAKALSFDPKSPIVFQGTGIYKKQDTTARKLVTIEGVLSENTLLDNAKALNLHQDDITVHGFRSTFRDWARERTNYNRDVAEKCLSHTNANKVEAAYLRTDLIKERKELLKLWNKYCNAEL